MKPCSAPEGEVAVSLCCRTEAMCGGGDDGGGGGGADGGGSSSDERLRLDL